ncbi:MAG TPA: response regulator [Methylomirabilota bacterium]
MALVLVVDDDSEVLAVLREALEGAGHRVVTADDGREGLKVYHAQHPDLIITDIFMPGRSGIDLVLQLGRETPRPKMIAISGVAGQEFLDAAAQVHVGRAFTKPFDVDEVVRAVDAMVNGHSG